MNISIDKLRPGMVIKDPIYIGNNKIPYIRHGEVLTEKIIDKIMKIPNLTSITVTFSEISDKVVRETVSSEIKDIAKHAIKSRDVNAKVKSAQLIAANILSSNKYSYNLLKYVLEEVTAEDTTLNIVEFSVAFSEIYNEYRGNDCGLNIDGNEIAVAAILHNIGIYYRNHIDEISKLKEINLSPKQFPGFKKEAFKVKDKSEYSYSYETLYAYSFVNEYSSISQNSKVAILLQRENDNGTGPLECKLDNVNNKAKIMAQLIQIAELYERLIEAACKDNHKTPADVFNGLKVAAARGIINKDLTKIITRNMELYPIGTRVVLNDGTIGEVIESTIAPEKPKIKVESDINGVTSIYDDGFLIDLSVVPHLKIMSVYDFGLKSNKEEKTNKQSK